ncbi:MULTISPECIES: NUDIX domain-containing protein [Alteromonadaceae]|uniref:NUDIX domain-containing protein n=1 Tax=Alteromonadaceae TaxID=72275 RepID=UPI001C085CEE|nr:NUDIX hydrolase [Aliiglaciecola lipolytica]MBU2877278.1 NUDIX hydrolase [Aliiglaciecola lipolytica]
MKFLRIARRFFESNNWLLLKNTTTLGSKTALSKNAPYPEFRLANIVPSIVKNKLVIYLAISSFCLTSCSETPPSDPVCRVDESEYPQQTANAACLIRLGDKLVTVTHRLSGKLDLPGGTSDNLESAKCTAHRETWEETGFNVEVRQWLGTSANGMRFYECNLDANFDDSFVEFPVPEWASLEVVSIQLVDPYATEFNQWRFPEQLTAVRDMFNKVEDSAVPPQPAHIK